MVVRLRVRSESDGKGVVRCLTAGRPRLGLTEAKHEAASMTAPFG